MMNKNDRGAKRPNSTGGDISGNRPQTRMREDGTEARLVCLPRFVTHCLNYSPRRVNPFFDITDAVGNAPRRGGITASSASAIAVSGPKIVRYGDVALQTHILPSRLSRGGEGDARHGGDHHD